MRGFFSNIYCENLVKLLQEKLTSVADPSMTVSPWWFLTLRPSTLSLQQCAITVLLFLPWHWLPWRFWLICFCSGKFWFSVFACCSQWFWGHQFALWPHFSYRCKKTYWFFSLFNFLLVIIKKWWLPSSLHGELETGSYVLLFYYLICINAMWWIAKISSWEEYNKSNMVFFVFFFMVCF